jgi:hypothetical protein
MPGWAGSPPAADRSLARAEEKLSRLETTRETVAEILGAERPIARGGAEAAAVDGDRHQIELTQAEAARREAEIRLVIDLVHVLEYLWAAAWCFHTAGDPAAEDWVAVQALAVLAGRPGR